MKTGLTVPPQERHVLRVFALDITRDEALRLRDGPDRDTALGALLGVARLDPAHVEIMDVADLDGVGLAQFLIDGHGAVDAQIAADRPRLDALEGYVMIVTSGAFPASGVTLRPDVVAALVGVYREDVEDIHFDVLPSAGAKGVLTPPPVPVPAPAPGRTGLSIGLVVLGVLVLLALAKILLR